MLMTIFAFGRYVDVANYNFVCPYPHEATHGVLLGLGMLLLLDYGHLRRWRDGVPIVARPGRNEGTHHHLEVPHASHPAATVPPAV